MMDSFSQFLIAVFAIMAAHDLGRRWIERDTRNHKEGRTDG